MKKIMLAVCLMFGGATLINAQEQPDQTATQSQPQQDQDRQQISVSELPEEVSSKLESQDYAAWTVGNVYKSTDESQNEIYIIEMRQGTETKKVKFDKDGNKLDKEHKKDSQYHDESQEDATEKDDNAEFPQEQQ